MLGCERLRDETLFQRFAPSLEINDDKVEIMEYRRTGDGENKTQVQRMRLGVRKREGGGGGVGRDGSRNATF